MVLRQVTNNEESLVEQMSVLGKKNEIDGRNRYMEGFIVKWFQGRINYNEIFSPMMNMMTIRLVTSIL